MSDVLVEWLIGLGVVDGLVRLISLIFAASFTRDADDRVAGGAPPQDRLVQEWREHGRVSGRLFVFGSFYGLFRAGKVATKLLNDGWKGADLPSPAKLLPGKRDPSPGQLAIAPGEGGEVSEVE